MGAGLMKLVVFGLIFMIHGVLWCGCGSIIMLYGSSSSGKTSLMNEVIKLDGSWSALSEDEIMVTEWLGAISEIFPSEYELISKVVGCGDLMAAINKNVVLFDKEASAGDCSRALDAIKVIQEKMVGELSNSFRADFSERFEAATLRALKGKLSEGKNVVFDRWCISYETLIKELPEVGVSKALIFLPLDKNLERLARRNKLAKEQGALGDHRFYIQVIHFFVDLYNVMSESDNALYSFKKRELLNLFNEIRRDLKVEGKVDRESIVLKELSQYELDQYMASFIPEYIGEDEMLYLVPSEEYDVVLNTDVNTSEAVARQLLSKFTGVKV
jgi:hypothetical protein